MPNWCSNAISVTGPADAVAAALIAAGVAPGRDEGGERPAFSLAAIVPQPGGLAERATGDWMELMVRAPGDGEADDWYTWRCREWGTKWDVDAQVTHDTTDAGGTRRVQIVFDSAWGPPIPVTVAWSRQHPQVTLLHAWDEPGNGYGGHAQLVSGEVTASADHGSVSGIRWQYQTDPTGDPVDPDVVDAVSTLPGVTAEPLVVVGWTGEVPEEPLALEDVTGHPDAHLTLLRMTAAAVEAALALLPGWWAGQAYPRHAPTPAQLAALTRATPGAQATGWASTDPDASGITLAGLLMPSPADDEQADVYRSLAAGLHADEVTSGEDGWQISWHLH